MAAARAVRSAVRQVLSTRRFVERARKLEEITLEGVRVRLLEDDRPHAFCAGLLRPSVYLSTGAKATLSRAELRAVLAHEEHHARQRDPLRLLVAQVAGEGLFFLPGMRRARRRYADLAEIAADEAAVRRTGGPAALAAALLRFERHATAGAVGISPERVEHLAGAHPRPELSASLLAGACAAILGLATLTYAAAAVTPSGGLSLATLSMHACAVAMVAVPVVAATWVLTAGRIPSAAPSPARRTPRS